MSVAQTAQNLYALGETKKANDLIKKSTVYIQKQMTYLADVSKSKDILVGGREGQIALNYGLVPMAQVASQYKQTKIAEDIAKQYQELDARFNYVFSRSMQQQGE